MSQRKHFCEYNPLFYQISLHKEYTKRYLKDMISPAKFAKNTQQDNLPIIIKSHCSVLLRKLVGVDEQFQHNKVKNLNLALQHISGIIIRPEETFSFWKLVGKPTKKKGYLEGLTIINGKSVGDIGGGLCQLANMIHWLVLHSPLEVVELHHHSDALFPDAGRRVPFGTGTSIFYNNIDYRFVNHTNQEIQLLLWCDDSYLCGELRTTEEFPYRYRIEEKNHYFAQEGNDYFRNSTVYRNIIEKNTNTVVKREIILKNHSKVLYDSSLIPTELLRM